MERYIKEFIEQSENKPDKEVINLINRLRDEKWSNEDQRKEFCKIITQISLHSDSEARRFIKELGNFCSDYLMKHEKE